MRLDKLTGHEPPGSRRDKIVVTGLGMITSIGSGRELFWKSLLAGECGIGPVTAFDTSPFPVHCGAEVTDFSPEEYVLNLPPLRIGRASQFAVAAARLAFADAGVSVPDSPAEDFGVVVVTTSGEPRVIERFDDHYVAEELEKISGDFISTYPSHVLAAHVA
jgi:3-oxoacyl-[acyl-carrier-protein] synthase II